MTYLLKRITTDPNSPMRIMISDPVNGGGLLNSGGTFYFAPAGQDGDQAQVSEYAAKAIMGDRDLAQHFTCTPPLESAAKPPAPVEPESSAASNEATDATNGDTGERRRRRRAAADAPAE